MLSFQTANSSTYLKIKSSLKNLGFKYINTDKFKGAILMNYKKGDLEVTLGSAVQENGVTMSKITNYEISVAKIN